MPGEGWLTLHGTFDRLGLLERLKAESSREEGGDDIGHGPVVLDDAVHEPRGLTPSSTEVLAEQPTTVGLAIR